MPAATPTWSRSAAPPRSRGRGGTSGGPGRRRTKGTGAAAFGWPSGGGKGPASAKLSYKQKFALEKLPKEIADLEKAIAKAEGEMADPSLFSKDPKRFQSLAGKLDQDRAALGEGRGRVAGAGDAAGRDRGLSRRPL